MAASATFALKAGVWFRRGRLLMVSPDSRSTACPPSGRNSTYRPVQISGTGSDYADAHWNKSLALLLFGHFDKGWEEYEWRWKVGVSSQRARCHVGESPTEAKRLRLRSKRGDVARKQDGGALRQHARKECARSIRLQRTVNADVASLHVLYPVAETVD